jgi:hypothetical protein
MIMECDVDQSRLKWEGKVLYQYQYQYKYKYKYKCIKI